LSVNHLGNEKEGKGRPEERCSGWGVNGPSLIIFLHHEIIKSGKAPLHCSSFYEIPWTKSPGYLKFVGD
jgi:hypothetical protein